MFPAYKEKEGHPSDLIRQYELARKNRSIGKQRTGKDSPHVRFANAITDDEFASFVCTFGPVVAESVHLGVEPPFILTATQDIRELKNEQAVYRAALSLIVELTQRTFDYAAAQGLIGKIATGISDWPKQWRRERSQRKHSEPSWKLSNESLKRIKQLSSGNPDELIDGRIVICELLNVFPAVAFPNPLEMHSSILFGIRPLLYSILRREFLYPHETGVCANTRCREFFEVERGGQRFCDDSCSLQQRQGMYWKSRGKELRRKRVKKQRKQ